MNKRIFIHLLQNAGLRNADSSITAYFDLDQAAQAELPEFRVKLLLLETGTTAAILACLEYCDKLRDYYQRLPD
ncbi:hypothetical protein [Ectopseudomonas mendocina]|uniref:hypothetical protein n=1 Tax=Ectopseudomonas mendocina TaxID=300 RepID=UPI003F11FE53